MMRRKLAIILCGLSCTACSERLSIKQSHSIFTNPGDIYISVNDVVPDEETKTEATPDESKGLIFKWAEGDKVGVYSGEGGMALFNIRSGEGSSNAFFHGDGFSLKAGNTFYAMYPYNGNATSSAAIPLDYSNRKISGNNVTDDLIPFGYMSANAVADNDSHAMFNFSHLSSFARLKLTLPKSETITSVDLVPTYGTLPDALTYNIVTGVSAVSSSKVVKNIPVSNISGTQMTAWIPFAAQELSDAALVVNTSSGNTYTARLGGKAMKAGKSYRWEVDAPAYPTAPSSEMSLSTLKVNTISSMPSGEYSGITRISDSKYAVVHDKYNGGGIIFFNLSFNNSGSITSSSYEIPSGTSEASNSRDPEGIVYVPSRQTLFVSGEADQKVLEYDLNGVPTGKGLAVPSDMSTSGIQGNYGIESLAYNATTGLFWTTTESVLKKDIDYKLGSTSLVRLQSFSDETLEAAQRYFYQTDSPKYGPGTNITYAFGVPDILALDDGKLIIIEREAYVPTGSISEMAQSVTIIKFYLVDPVNDKGGILSKKLLHTINTNVVSGIMGETGWANYEGICFGPTLPNGTKTILLVNDSQSRYKGVLKDLLAVLKY